MSPTRSSSLEPDAWIARYAAAWQEGDVDAVKTIFTSSTVYRVTPFEPPHVGTDAIRQYWADIGSRQLEVRVRFGVPIVNGSLAAVEWWTTLVASDSMQETTLAGCLILNFNPDGRCEELREYWFSSPGSLAPLISMGLRESTP